MRIVLPAIGVAFAAFAVWFTVRLVNRRGKVGRRFWISAAVVVALGYPISFGPVCWLCSARMLPLAPVGYFYWPFVYRASCEDGFGSVLLDSYANFLTPRSDIVGDLLRAVAES